ncbi:MAG: MFS transporter [Rhodospirillales bacterium]|nr:MFS transporter [Rhodospirillales bacterium]
MSLVSARLSLAFSCLGHASSHLFQPIFYVAVLALEPELGMTHGEAIALIVAGNVLMGAGAPLAGWLGDRWRATGMMVVFFFGTGGAMVATGFAETPLAIALWLAVTGLFASIYHPVGFAWVASNAVKQGTAFGINAIFGSLGNAIAALGAGALIAAWSWRAAFIVPGAVVAAIGAAFLAVVVRGLIVEPRADRVATKPASRDDMVRAFVALSFTMFCAGMIYSATQPALPKLFSERLGDVGVLGVSATVAGVYFIAGFMQLIAGLLIDRFDARNVYVWSFLAQVPILLLVAVTAGAPLAALVLGMVVFNIVSGPAENVLVTRYSPRRWRGLAFGLKFILSFGLAGLGVVMEGTLYDLTGGFYWLFVVMAGFAVAGWVSGLWLPGRGAARVPAPAE